MFKPNSISVLYACVSLGVLLQHLCWLRNMCGACRQVGGFLAAARLRGMESCLLHATGVLDPTQLLVEAYVMRCEWHCGHNKPFMQAPWCP
jgi:hypothetical protein